MTKYLDYIGLSDYDGKIKELVNSKIAQVETLPTPSASNNGTILEYIGESSCAP